MIKKKVEMLIFKHAFWVKINSHFPLLSLLSPRVSLFKCLWHLSQSVCFTFSQIRCLSAQTPIFTNGEIQRWATTDTKILEKYIFKKFPPKHSGCQDWLNTHTYTTHFSNHSWNTHSGWLSSNIHSISVKLVLTHSLYQRLVGNGQEM